MRTDAPTGYFDEVVAPFTPQEARDEASRCYYCYDAPCIHGCPTAINIPVFIRQIGEGDWAAASRTILDANILGATCARICPTEALCEGSCVRNEDSHAVAIGRLQRVATDFAMDRSAPPLTLPPKARQVSGRVAIVGGGPAALSAAAELRRHGCSADIYEAQPSLGGLDTYGIVSYREPLPVSAWETGLVLQLGAVAHLNTRVGQDIGWRDLEQNCDALIIATGLGQVPHLNIPGEQLAGVWDALELIALTKTGHLDDIDLGARVAVIGAGNTAIDAATCAKRLGAERVSILYRRGEAAMPAYSYEYAFAKQDGIVFEWWTQAVEIVGQHHVEALRCQRTVPLLGHADDRVAPVSIQDDVEWLMPIDTVIRAIGQIKPPGPWDALQLAHHGSVPRVDPDTCETSAPGIYAIGDCLAPPGEATVVNAVAQGKKAATAIVNTLWKAQHMADRGKEE